jgi:hypothetical protein
LQKKQRVLEQKVRMLEQGDIGAELVALVQRAGTLNSPGADNQLSTTGANMALFLHSQVGVPFAQMPDTVIAVLQMLLGRLSPATIQDVTFAPMTYTNGADRVSRLLEDQVRQAIADRERTDRIVSMSIMLDASNKKGVDLIAKNLVMLRADGDIDCRQLRTHSGQSSACSVSP